MTSIHTTGTDTTGILTSIWAHAERTPEAVALREGDSAWTYARLVAAACGFARSLHDDGLEPGARVMLVAPTSAAFVTAYLGALAAGAVVVTVNPLHTRRELAFVTDDSGASTIVAWADQKDAAAEVARERGVPLRLIDDRTAHVGGPVSAPVPRGADDPAVLLYTSGTTGRPKGAILTHGNLRASTGILAEALDVTAADRLGTALPLFHVFGQVGVLALGLVAGATVSLLRPFSAAGLLRMIEGHALTIVSGVPTMWIEMLHASATMEPPPDITSLRIACSGGAALPQEIARAFHASFGAVVVDGYALSETAAAAAFHRPALAPRAGSVGQPLPRLTVEILDEDGRPVPTGEVGEITISGPVVTPGYWNDPVATGEALRGGRLWTGDLGRADEDGFLWIVDRKKELIIRGGYNVYPREVEELLFQHPHVREAAVVGVPDSRLGEEVAAVIVTAPGTLIAPDDMRAWLDELLAAYKVPRLYHFVESLPKGSTGKVLKREIDRDEIVRTAVRTRSSRYQGEPA